MLKLLRFTYVSIILSTLLFLSGCGFQLQKEPDVPNEFKYIQLYSNDKYGMLTRNIRQILAANNVTIVNEQPNYPPKESNNYPALYILGTSTNTAVTSIYPSGSSAESQMVFTANAKVVVNDKSYPLSAKIFRAFFDNPATPLAKSTEEDLIRDEMYTQAARELIQQLKSVAIAIN